MKKILLISGHGAGDPGATATYGSTTYKEATETITMVRKIRKYLKKRKVQVDLYPIRRDAFRDLQNGNLQVDFSQYDYVLEVHFNAFKPDANGDGKNKGTEIFVPQGGKEDVAIRIVNSVAKLGFNNKGKKSVNYSVIYHAKTSGTDAALLEVCFIDDKDDMNIYIPNKDKIAEQIAMALIVSFNLKLKSDNTIKAGDKVRIKKGAKDLNTKKKFSDFVYGTTYTVIKTSSSGKQIVFGLNGIAVGKCWKRYVEEV